MGRLLKIFEIDEFAEVKNIPPIAITELIIQNIRNLDEEKELEKFLREIIFDPIQTPHGPTEIVDILTDLNYDGKKRTAAFVLKGKSYPKVSAREVTHQLARLHTIPNLNTAILGAVGNIQDDAQ